MGALQLMPPSSRMQSAACSNPSFIDYWCGEILKAYRGKGRLDDLFIVLLSDHGEMAGDHGRLYKRTFHKSALRIPLIMRWPGRIPAGGECDGLIENIDASSGILEAIGIDKLQMSLGQSIWHLVGDRTERHRPEVLSEVYYDGSRNIMIKNNRYKYVIDHKGSGYMLYDMVQNPQEQHNLIGDPSSGVAEAEMRDAMLRRLAAGTFVMEAVNL